jgi:hypothetical protein
MGARKSFDGLDLIAAMAGALVGLGIDLAVRQAFGFRLFRGFHAVGAVIGIAVLRIATWRKSSGTEARNIRLLLWIGGVLAAIFVLGEILIPLCVRGW